MLANRRYAQWRSRFLRYIDTRPNGDALRKCILTGSYIPTTGQLHLAFLATEDVSRNSLQNISRNSSNMTPENKAHYESEKEAIHLILTGIGDEIYSTVDACQTAQEMWEAIESDPKQAQKVKDMLKIWLSLQSTSRNYTQPTNNNSELLKHQKKQECGYYAKNTD
ncbi:hypothetical protein Tco_0033708 [Tanacetum coccineum]